MSRFWMAVIAWVVFVFTIVSSISPLLPVRPDFEFTVFSSFSQKQTSPLSGLYSLANFDGIHYLQIAGDGYSDQGRFLPLYPFLIAIVTTLTAAETLSGVQFVGTTLLNLILFFGMIYVWREIFKQDYSLEVADETLLLFLSLPTAFFLLSVYSEALFLLLAGVTILLVRKKWLWGVITASLLTITRVPGLAVGFYFLGMLSRADDKSISKHRISKLLSLALITVPLLVYVLFNHQTWGSWNYFLTAHQTVNSGRSVGFVFPLITLYRYLNIIRSVSPNLYEFYLAAAELATFFVGTLMTVLAVLKKVKLELILFAVGAFIIPALSGTFTGLPRYALVLLPLLPAVTVTFEKHTRKAVAVTSLILQVVALLLFSRGYFIG